MIIFAGAISTLCLVLDIAFSGFALPQFQWINSWWVRGPTVVSGLYVTGHLFAISFGWVNL